MTPNQSLQQLELTAPFASEAKEDPACPQANEEWLPEPMVSLIPTPSSYGPSHEPHHSHHRHYLSLMWLLMIPLEVMFYQEC